MPVYEPTREEDMRVLELLYEAKKTNATKAAEKLGTTRSAIQGYLTRTHVRRPETAPWPCECNKPENQDGGMPERWWA